ncbi:MAG TPA: DNA (cytosine-5-)-methyltransferase [Lentisphaeria bacterium]|nr:MAG: DNA (cytosine-5-)-methyltransferase [Lentisphaerae bacterium GWF2_49_21]HBC88750.1 DNA (cytosine-5-)-methyltransferase [Lentisphaeria bacterium]
MKIVSLFSGAGGLDLGLIKAGHKIIWANDIDPDSCETYRLNIGKHIVCSDISIIKLEDIPDCDVVVGGFPCQGFSMANMLRTAGDERNKLYKHFHRVIKGKKPYYFIAENVRGILCLDKGNAIKKIVKDFSDAGYRVKYQLFNMADFGVPQTRIRVIIAGTRKDLPKEKEFQFPPPTHNKTTWISIFNALKNIPEPEDPKLKFKNHIYSKYKVTNRNFTGHRKTDPSKPSPTILARGNGKGGVCAIQHPKNHRRMSVRESALVQTFPVDFEFVGSMGSMYRQVGNAVPVLFGHHLGNKLKQLKAIVV